jgi:hypothetical protein
MNAADVRRVTILSAISSACTLYAGSGDIDAVIAAAERFYAEATGQRAPLEAEREAVGAKITHSG